MINVTKRDGRIVPFNIESLRTAIAWATDGLDANPLELEAVMQLRLVEGISTVDIQENLINGATSLASPSAPDWRYVAGRLQMWTYKKQTMLDRGFGELYVQAVDHLTYGKWYSEELKNNYDQSELEIAASWIDPDRDRDYDLAGVTTLVRKYLLPGELPQEAFLTVALLIASVEELGNRLKVAREVYDAISLRKISLATPILANLRVPNGNLSSCFIIGVNDSLESIFDNLKNAARISKNGGGVGINLSHIRAKGSWVNRRENASKGITSWSKLFNDTAVSVDQNGKRAGAFTLSLDIWHLDVLDFLELQTETGDQRSKAYDIFPQLVIPDLFMQKVLQRKTWVLFDPYEVKEKYNIDLAKSWGGHFEQQYTFLVEQFNNQQLKLAKIIDANALFKQIMRTQLETGLPYLAFKDTINRANPNKHLGYIPGVNLCVESFSNVKPDEEAHTCLAQGTQILTKNGWKPIEDCEGEEVVTAYKSDKNLTKEPSYVKATLIDNGVKPVYDVKLKNFRTITATEDHKFLVGKDWVTVKDLEEGDKLTVFVPSRQDLPRVTQNTLDQSIGWLLGDGWVRPRSIGVCFSPEDVYAKDLVVNELFNQWYDLPKQKCGHHDLTRKIRVDSRTGVLSWSSGSKAVHNWLLDKYGLDYAKAAGKHLPGGINSWGLDRVSSLLSGLFSSDGCVQTPNNPRNKPYVQLSSSSFDLLNQVRDQLVRFGIHSTIGWYTPKGRNPQGNLTIQGVGVLDFSKYIGFSLSIAKSEKLASVVSQFDNLSNFRTSSEIISIEYAGETQVYDLNVPEKHHFVAEGIVSHNCNLNSLNMANIGDYELEAMSKLAVRILDNLIDMTTTPIKESQTHNNLYRTIGVGVMGLADYLAKNEKTYRDLDFIGAFAEKFNYYTTLGSVELALERGAYGAFTGSEWDGGLLANSKSLSWFLDHSYSDEMSYKWVKLHGMIEKYGIRNSHIQAIAPNTTSSLLQGCTASVLPAFGKFYYDKSSKGSVPIAPPFIGDKWWYYQENKTMDQKVVIEALAKLQQYVDTGISSELMFNLNEGMFNGGTLTAKDIYDRLILAWKLGLKTIYYIRSVTKQDLEKKEYGCTSCTN